jgi:hypothetical protein
MQENNTKRKSKPFSEEFLKEHLSPESIKKLKVKPKATKLKSENTVRKECNKWLKDNLWIQKTIYTGGIPIFGGGHATNPAKGIPDCIAFHRPTKRRVWIEYKNSEGGNLSIDQKDWHYLLRLVGDEVYIITSKKQLIEVLTSETIK